MTLELSQEVLNRRRFNQDIYDLHSKEYMLGQTARYIDRFKCVLDIGAAVGMYSTFWASKCSRLHAYEAVPPVYKQLKKLELDFDNVTTHNIAMSETVGETSFFVDDKRLSNSSFRDLVGGQEIKVKTTTIDNEGHRSVGFIKVDVEGHELEVLKGGIKTLEKDRPVCMVEVYPKFNNGPVSDTFDFFFERDYKCFYNIRGVGLQQINGTIDGVNIASDEAIIQQHDGDFLFVPKER
jgi:FkbM family methyltransferase